VDYKAEHITYQYAADAPKVLKDVTFDIQKGKVTAIVGPTGCGKSTLVEIFSGVIPKLITNGTLEGSLNGADDAFVSVVSQNPENQLFGYSSEDAIVFGLENLGLPREEISERLEYVLNLLNLQYLRKRSVANLSGGQRQSVCIASVLAMQPDILILDEPVSSLDPSGKAMVKGVLKQLAADMNTVVLADNNLVWSAEIVDHVIGLCNGEVIFDGSRDEFFADADLQKKLGVIIPQEVEICQTLSAVCPDLKPFFTLEGARAELGRKITVRGTVPAFRPETDSNAPKEPVVTTRELNQIFKDGFHALKDINTSIPEGKVVAVLGQNGSGKTTYVKHLNGLYRATSGEVCYRGESTAEKSVAEISRNIILVFQHPEHMLFEETVADEITFCARKQGTSYTEEDVTRILREYGMEEDRDLFPLNLPMGKKHMLTIASVLLSHADVIILDEPTLGMDAVLIAQLETLIASLKKAGKTVVMISHEIPLVFRTADAAVVLGQGKKLAEGGIEEIARMTELFEKIGIALPPVVLLSMEFGFDRVCFNVSDFAEEYMKTIVNQ